ncbi:hypothetical protein GQ54DRAFT_259592 [Martensiomyces pterosporus]|nr:hypothetical protein GQ54DRAFT_259592 [Martensiomyces pterosporus]
MNTVDGSRIVSEWTVSEGIQSRTLADALPSSWVACGVSIDRSRNIMFVTRYQNGHGPVAVCLPMRTVEAGADTFDIGVGDAESQGAFDGAYQKLKTIIAESDKTMKTGSSCSTDDEKRKWWLHRTSLDRQLGDLLESIEDEWLSGFKGILQPEDSLSGDIDIDLLRSRIQSCVGKSLSKAFATKAKSLDLSDNICLFVLNAAGRIWRHHSGHSSKEACESSDWLDVCSMLLDTYCYQGAAPTFEEDGINEFADRLKDAALEFIDSTGIGKREDKASGKRHLILVLDKHAQQIPWECLPCLRDYPISRMPSVAFLQHRVSGTALPADHPPGVAADSSRVFYILNPEGDLHRTQSNFEDYLRGQASWHGVIDRKPMSHECEHGISSSDVFLYFGHGGAESYISRSQIRKLRRCAVSLLVGCSSGHLKPAGEYDAMGTAMDYMIGGCPTLVANLWDVGDKDIDRFTAEMLHSWGLDQHTSGKVALMADQEDAPPGQQVSLAEAVCKARKACRMAFLTGAAPVVYGIPAYLC